MRKRIVLAAAVLAGLVTLPSGVASAHHPVLTASTDRPCGTDQSWTATFTAMSDGDYGKDWRTTYTIVGAATVGPSDWVDDQDDFGPIDIGPFPATTADVTISVTSEWRRPSGGGAAIATRTIVVQRPQPSDCDGGQPVAPRVDPPSCTAPGAVIGTDTAGYTFVYDGPDSERTATAIARPGYALTGAAEFGPYDISQLSPDSKTCLPCPGNPQLGADSDECGYYTPTTTAAPTTTIDATTTTTVVGSQLGAGTTTTTTPKASTTTAPTTTVSPGDPTNDVANNTNFHQTTTTAPSGDPANDVATSTDGQQPTTTTPVELPRTGSDTTRGIALVGLLFVVAGTMITTITRRRPTV